VINNVMRDEGQVLYLGRIIRSKNLDLLAKSMVYVREVKGCRVSFSRS
jgi:glycosyltransferase involved in cell wall biosynthesis